MTGVLGVVFTLLVIVAVVVAVVRGRDLVDLSPRGLMHGYLYVGSLAGIVVLSIGLGSLTNWGLAAVLGNDAIYGGQTAVPAIAVAPCPPNQPNCVQPPRPDFTEQQRRETERRRAEDLIRGATFSAFGLVFWLAHWYARRMLAVGEAAAGLRRTYLLVGAIGFGLATIVLLPTGIYQVLSNVVLVAPDRFRPPADALGGGIVVLVVWLVYLRLAVRELRTQPV